MASSLRRLIEEVAVVKPGCEASRSTSDAAKAALGLDVPITQVLDHTLGAAAQPAGAGASTAVSRSVRGSPRQLAKVG